MLERLWFSLCAVAAVLSFGLGALFVGVGTVEEMGRGRPVHLGMVAAGLAFAVIGPLAARFAYRWGLWVARGSG